MRASTDSLIGSQGHSLESDLQPLPCMPITHLIGMVQYRLSGLWGKSVGMCAGVFARRDA